MTFGSYIHEIFELGVNAKHESELVRISEEIKGKYNIPDSKKAATLKCIKNFLVFNSGIQAKGTETLGCEITYSIDLGNGINATGVIDRVLRSKTGSIMVIDYKTSKREKSKVQLYQDNQLKGYALAACELYNIPVSEAAKKIVCAHYYPMSNNFVPVNYPASELIKHNKKILETAWNIRKATMESLTPAQNEFCDYCQYKHICPLYQDGNTIKCNLILEEQKKEAKRLEESIDQSL